MGAMRTCEVRCRDGLRLSLLAFFFAGCWGARIDAGHSAASTSLKVAPCEVGILRPNSRKGHSPGAGLESDTLLAEGSRRNTTEAQWHFNAFGQAATPTNHRVATDGQTLAGVEKEGWGPTSDEVAETLSKYGAFREMRCPVSIMGILDSGCRVCSCMAYVHQCYPKYVQLKHHGVEWDEGIDIGVCQPSVWLISLSAPAVFSVLLCVIICLRKVCTSPDDNDPRPPYARLHDCDSKHGFTSQTPPSKNASFDSPPTPGSEEEDFRKTSLGSHYTSEGSG